jgi:hypothetical protein
MSKVHIHDGGIDGILCDADDCAYMKYARARKRQARWLAGSICAIAATISAVAIAAEHRYGLVFLGLFLIFVPIVCHEVLLDRGHPI